jgi:lycopene cyclase domain-containing protein
MSEGRTAYLVHLLVFGLPVLGLQVLLLAKAFGPRLGALFRAVLPPALLVTAWLVLADEFAIAGGVWAFGQTKQLGLYLGHVPVEEALFFLLTNLLVACGVPLFSQRTAVSAAGREVPR